MLGIDVTTVSALHPVTWVTLRGPLATFDHVHALRQTLVSLADGPRVVLDLRRVVELSETGITGLARAAADAGARRDHLVFVVTDGPTRARLVRADLHHCCELADTVDKALGVLAAA